MKPNIPDDMVERAWLRIATSSIPNVVTIDRDDLRAALAEAVMATEDEICAFLESIHHHSTAAAIRARKEQSK